jgi:hypothetical protein
VSKRKGGIKPKKSSISTPWYLSSLYAEIPKIIEMVVSLPRESLLNEVDVAGMLTIANSFSHVITKSATAAD